MNSWLGFGFISLGFVASVLGVSGGLYSLLSRNLTLLRFVRQWTWVVLTGAIGAFVVMEIALFQRDYSLEYVQQVGSAETPPLFNFAALWSSLEGSLILWALVLAIYLVAVGIKFAKRERDELFGWALVVMFLVSSFFFALLVGPANPFLVADIPEGFTGPGPNPLLQNHVLMAFHPPILYIGYVGFTVPFSFAIGALITGRIGEGWLAETRRWALTAWGCLTFGILLGAWWSYEVLGWGGYWTWDPVENASLLPWLTGTAYIHSVMVQERRGMLRVWNLSLLCATFSLTILGTFLTRSGVIVSVHAFADGAVGPWLLAFFGLIAVGSIALVIWRGEKLASAGAIDDPISRESSLLFNNLAFGALAFVVLLGTVFPLIAEVQGDNLFRTGRPYFDNMSRPIGLMILFLMAAAPALPWRKASTELLSKRLFWPAVVGVSAMALALALGARGFYPLLTFGLGGFAGGAAIRQLYLSLRRNGLGGLFGRSNGGMVVHLGIVLLAIGLAASESYSSTRTMTVQVGETVTVTGHQFTYTGTRADVNNRRVKAYAAIELDGGQTYEPSISEFVNGRQGNSIKTPSVRTGVFQDVYMVLDGWPDPADDSVPLLIMVRPMVAWIWTGGILMAFGTLLALIPTKRRQNNLSALTGAASTSVSGAESAPESESASISGSPLELESAPGWESAPGPGPGSLSELESASGSVSVSGSLSELELQGHESEDEADV